MAPPSWPFTGLFLVPHSILLTSISSGVMNPPLWCHLVRGASLSPNSLLSFHWLPFQFFPLCLLKTLFLCTKASPHPVSTWHAFASSPSVKPGSLLGTFPSFSSSQIKDGEARCTSRHWCTTMSHFVYVMCQHYLSSTLPLSASPSSSEIHTIQLYGP